MRARALRSTAVAGVAGHVHPASPQWILQGQTLCLFSQLWPVSVRDLTYYGNRHAVLVRIDCVAALLLFWTYNELADDTRTTVAMVARQKV